METCSPIAPLALGKTECIPHSWRVGVRSSSAFHTLSSHTITNKSVPDALCIYHARIQVWKHPLFNRNRWIWRPNTPPPPPPPPPFWGKKTFFFRYIWQGYLFVKKNSMYKTFFLCTSYFSLLPMYGQSSKIHLCITIQTCGLILCLGPGFDQMKIQMEINTCKILPFFKISRTHAWKITLFSRFREFVPPIEKIHSLFWVRAWSWVRGWGGVETCASRTQGNERVVLILISSSEKKQMLNEQFGYDQQWLIIILDKLICVIRCVKGV